MSEFTNILALDTALGGCTAAVVAGDHSAVRSEVMARGQAEQLVPFANAAMEEAGIEYADLDAVLCTIGPGAFAGLRIGMSCARAFGLSLDIPVFGITTLDVLAMQFCAKESKPCSVILETKRKDFYFQHFDDQSHAVSKRDASEKINVPEGSILIGDGAKRFLEEQGEDYKHAEGYDLPDMVVMAKILQQGDERFARNAEPVYLRGADVSQPKNLPRKLENIA